MQLGTILFGAGLFILTLPFVLGPLRRGLSQQPTEFGQEDHSNGKADKEGLLLMLAELDFDHQLGKIAEQDHQYARAQLVAAAGKLIERQESSKIDAIEQLILDRKNKPESAMICNTCGDVTIASGRYCSSCGVERLEQRCENCGIPAAPEDIYCATCGASIRVSA